MAPQISEHCPKNKPGRLIKEKIWFKRPGIASIFIPKEGIVQEWITSIEEIRKRVLILKGIISRLSTSKRRKVLISIEFWGIINESKLILKSEYS